MAAAEYQKDPLADHDDEQQAPRRNPGDRTVVFDGYDESPDPEDAPYARGDASEAVG